MLPGKMKDKALKQAFRESSKMMAMKARGYITQPGYFGDKDPSEYPPLSKNIKWVVRGPKRKPFVAAHVGADYKKAPHFHLYERGHMQLTHDKEVPKKAKRKLSAGWISSERGKSTRERLEGRLLKRF
jgi:hypothetical protein